MKKLVITLLLISVLVSMFMIPSFADDENDRLAVGEAASMLDGKKILFAGCSYTYYGGCVIAVGANRDTYTIAEREHDIGYFYQICKANGAEVNVVDWTFGGHSLSDIFGEQCSHEEHVGYCHLDDLTDKNFDYVVLQELQRPKYKTIEDYYNSFLDTMNIFTEVNPDTKFLINLQEAIYARYPAEYKECLKMVAELPNVTMVDWGSLVYDVYKGNVEVPGATMPYYRNSFVVSRASDDGHHQNVVSGYLNALMVYTGITGETAVGQPYDFITAEPPIAGRLDLDYYNKTYYKYDNPMTDFDESKSNFIDILNSDADMRGLQTLADEYMNNKKGWYNTTYEITFKAEDGSILSKGIYGYLDEVVIPEIPEKESPHYYTNVPSWDKEPSAVCRGSATYTATYKKEYENYTVTFKNLDGTVISERTYIYGNAIRVPKDPTLANDAEYSYTFTGWDKEIPSTCVGDAVFTAVYEKTALNPDIEEPIIPPCEIPSEPDNTGLIVGISVGVAVLLIGGGVALWFFKKKRG